MTPIRRTIHKLLLLSATAFMLGGVALPAAAASAQDLERDATESLQALYKVQPSA